MKLKLHILPEPFLSDWFDSIPVAVYTHFFTQAYKRIDANVLVFVLFLIWLGKLNNLFEQIDFSTRLPSVIISSRQNRDLAEKFISPKQTKLQYSNLSLLKYSDYSPWSIISHLHSYANDWREEIDYFFSFMETSCAASRYDKSQIKRNNWPAKL